MTRKKLHFLTGEFFKKQSNDVLLKLIHAKTKKSSEKYNLQLNAIRNRIAYEIKLIDETTETGEE